MELKLGWKQIVTGNRLGLPSEVMDKLRVKVGDAVYFMYDEDTDRIYLEKAHVEPVSE